MEKMLNIKINNIPCTVPYGTTILEAARSIGIEVPTLCFLKDMNEIGACRFCVAEVKGARSLVAACVYPIERDGTEIFTDNAKIRASRKKTLELILSTHDRKCLSCIRSGSCELQKLCREYNIDEVPYKGETRKWSMDTLSTSIVRDSSKCILCGRCVSTCRDVQGIGVLDFTNRGFKTEVAPAYDFSMRDVECVYCGQCIHACPVAALHERRNIDDVFAAIADPKKHVVVQAAPAVRASLGEEFGMPVGTRVTGKMIAAMRRLGFDKVFDTNWSADLTIMEEGHELLHRIKEGGVLPLITSCSPGWIRYCEMNYPEFIPNLSTCKSPQGMFGAMVKSYYAEKAGIDPKDIVCVSVMPCTSKKFEISRPELNVDGLTSVDFSITTRELGDMIKEARIRFETLPDEMPDRLMGEYTGAGAIFGATGGVMEAALRTVADVLTGKDLPDIDYKDCRGIAGIKEASVTLPIDGKDTEVKIAIANGTKNAAALLDAIKAGEKQYHFVEIMACPGGCVHGGGQSIISAKRRLDVEPRGKRADALYEEDLACAKRKSHENAEVQELYKEFLGEPNSHKAHHYLHTHYAPRPYYVKQ